MAYLPIDQYGVIGDLHTAALVGRNGSIDWLCLPRFDSPSLFGAILDDKKGGRFKIGATGEATTRQMYVPDTNVLITRFVTPDGVAELYDCMPIEVDAAGRRAVAHDLVRVIHGVRGTVDLELLCQPAFDYARVGHTVAGSRARLPVHLGREPSGERPGQPARERAADDRRTARRALDFTVTRGRLGRRSCWSG